jgi:hypothetical protein
MRLLPITLLYSLFATSIIAESSEKALGSTDATLESSDEGSDVPEPTVFNGVRVPALPDIEGEKFNTTVKDGYWFVKHHSSVSPVLFDHLGELESNFSPDHGVGTVLRLRRSGKPCTNITIPRNPFLPARPQIAHQLP